MTHSHIMPSAIPTLIRSSPSNLISLVLRFGMTILGRFLAFTNALPNDRLESVEEALTALMESYSADYEFTPQENAEIDRRLTVASPEFAAPESIAKLFGKPFVA